MHSKTNIMIVSQNFSGVGLQQGIQEFWLLEGAFILSRTDKLTDDAFWPPTHVLAFQYPMQILVMANTIQAALADVLSSLFFPSTQGALTLQTAASVWFMLGTLPSMTPTMMKIVSLAFSSRWRGRLCLLCLWPSVRAWPLPDPISRHSLMFANRKSGVYEHIWGTYVTQNYAENILYAIFNSVIGEAFI